MIESHKPIWYNDMTFVETNQQFHYHKYTYCGLVIIETYDHAFFNATRLMDQVMVKDDTGSGSASNRISAMMNLKFWSLQKEQHPKWFLKRNGAGSSKKGFGGQYMRWNLFNSFIEAAHAGASMYLDCGMEIPVDKSGYLYWCKPEKNQACLDTDSIKVGRTWNWNQRKNIYGKKTIEYRVIQSHDMYNDEGLLQEVVGRVLSHDQDKGDEYYILPRNGNEHYQDLCNKMHDIFDILVNKYNEEESLNTDIEQKENDETINDNPERIVYYDALIASHQDAINGFINELDAYQ